PEEATPLRGGHGLIGYLARAPTSWYTTPHESLCGDSRSTGIAMVPPRGVHAEGHTPACREDRVDALDDGRLGSPRRRGCRSDPGGSQRRPAWRGLQPAPEPRRRTAPAQFRLARVGRLGHELSSDPPGTRTDSGRSSGPARPRWAWHPAAPLSRR